MTGRNRENPEAETRRTGDDQKEAHWTTLSCRLYFKTVHIMNYELLT